MGKHPHIDDEQLELYLRSTLPEEAMEPVEEHLLFCEPCQTRLADLEVFVKTFREVAPVLAREDRIADASPSFGARLRDWFRQPLPLAAAAVACLALVVAPFAFRSAAPLGPPVTLELAALRAAAVPESTAHRPLDVKLDLTGLSPTPEFRLELVTADGETLLTRPLAPAFRVEQGLPAGRYWLRVYGPELVREFGFTLR